MCFWEDMIEKVMFFFFFQAEDGIRDGTVTGVQTCALPILTVVRMGDFSTELCGGTHVRRTGDIGVFKIGAESGVAAGVRRLEAVTGTGALDEIRRHEATLGEIAQLLKTGEQDAKGKLEK